MSTKPSYISLLIRPSLSLNFILISRTNLMISLLPMIIYDVLYETTTSLANAHDTDIILR